MSEHTRPDLALAGLPPVVTSRPTEAARPAPEVAVVARATSSATPWWLLAGIGLVLVLSDLLTAPGQLIDTNFYSLWEATSVRLGDNPYRDFFEWGVPLQVVVSMVAQFVVGHRLIGEFLIQWAFILIGTLIAVHIGYQLSRSVRATTIMAVIMLVLLTFTPTFHYPKLFFYPLAIWLTWRYLDRPTAVRAALLGVVTATGFLYRHDHGVYLGALAVVTLVLELLHDQGWRRLRGIVGRAAAYAAPIVVLVVPWAVYVQLNEGLPEYVAARQQLFANWSASESPYQWPRFTAVSFPAIEMRPLPPRAGAVSFEWFDFVSPEERARVEQDYGLRLLLTPSQTDGHRWRYEVANLDDVRLVELGKRYIDKTDGFDWDRLYAAAQSPLGRLGWGQFEVRVDPGLLRPQNGLIWVYEVVALLPLVVLVVAGVLWAVGRRPGLQRVFIVAAFLVLVDNKLFREFGYAMVVAPLTLALGAWLIVQAWGARAGGGPVALVGLGLRRVAAAALVVVTLVMASTYVDLPEMLDRQGVLDGFDRIVSEHKPVAQQLLASPPIDGYLPPTAPELARREVWDARMTNGEKTRVVLRYLHDCSQPTDRLLVMGSTPYDVGYYTDRRIAGGQVFWKDAWRSDPVRQAQTLAQLESQSVPFAYSSNAAVLEIFERYPLLRPYLVQNYYELPGTEGLVLVDRRRQPTRVYEPFGLPCFT